MSSISKTLRLLVISEAGRRCEYCRTASRIIGMPLVIDHIIPQSAGGSDKRENIDTLPAIPAPQLPTVKHKNKFEITP